MLSASLMIRKADNTVNSPKNSVGGRTRRDGSACAHKNTIPWSASQYNPVLRMTALSRRSFLHLAHLVKRQTVLLTVLGSNVGWTPLCQDHQLRKRSEAKTFILRIASIDLGGYAADSTAYFASCTTSSIRFTRQIQIVNGYLLGTIRCHRSHYSHFLGIPCRRNS